MNKTQKNKEKKTSTEKEKKQRIQQTNKTEKKENNHVRINTWQFVSELSVEPFAQNLSRKFSKHRFPTPKKIEYQKVSKEQI